MQIGGVAGAIVLIWLLIGVFAAWQRDYFRGHEVRCETAGTIAVTTLAGPLNYAGLKPVVSDCRLPQPSSLGAVDSVS